MSVGDNSRSQNTNPRTVAEENFKAEYGHYPIRVDFPAQTPDPQLDALVARLFQRGRAPKLRSIPGGKRS